MKILIMEDDQFFQKFYSTKLSELGYQVEVAGDGNEGLLKARQLMPDIILLDMIMPKKDGFEVLAARLQDPVLSQIPVLVFSTLGQEADIQKAKNLGATDYVNKSSFDFESLKAKIAQYQKAK